MESSQKYSMLMLKILGQFSRIQKKIMEDFSPYFNGIRAPHKPLRSFTNTSLITQPNSEDGTRSADL